MSHTPDSAISFAEQLEHLLEHLSHVLPAQAPIRDFVHHNTLHGFQHLPFPEAVRSAWELTGNRGYLPQTQFREYFRNGRIDRTDLDAVLDDDSQLNAAAAVITFADGRTVKRGDVFRTVLIASLTALTPNQLIWQMEEQQALERFQADVPLTAREQLLQTAEQSGLTTESAAIDDLWQACLQVLGLKQALVHPEEVLNVTPDTATQLFGEWLKAGKQTVAHTLKQQAHQSLQQLLVQIGHRLTLRGVLQQLLGQDILDSIRPLILRPLSIWLDQGVAPLADVQPQGFYVWWKQQAYLDWSAALDGIPDWQEHLDSLPDDAITTIEAELRRMGIPRAQWTHYLERLALDLPGWSGMVLWRHQHPQYQGLKQPVNMLDYLAVRLVLEHIFARHLCREHWLIEASLPELRGYFRKASSEFFVRYQTYKGHLPEYLMNLAQQLIVRSQTGLYSNARYDAAGWLHVGQLMLAWLNITTSHHADKTLDAKPSDHAWRLFRLAQHLGLDGATVRQITAPALPKLFACMDALNEQQAGFIWLQAYERHYREELYCAVISNHHQGTWASRDSRPLAQVICCMDDREEGFRRHLEEVEPQIETLGAAAFFDLPMNWLGLDDTQATKLCPVSITPVNLVQEKALPEAELLKQHHQERHRWRLHWFNGLHQWTRTRLVAGTATALAAAPGALTVMLGKSYAPLDFGQWASHLRQQFEGTVPTRVDFQAQKEDPQRSPEQNQLGFTDLEQAEIVSDFLRSCGLDRGFSPLVLMLGHYSTNQNNPHQAAYGCGACSGRYSGPNARTFAAMANRPAIRHLVAERGIQIPDDTWFMAAEHDTCTEAIRWADSDLMPARLQGSFYRLRNALALACAHSAHERCRKLASAPRHPTLAQALRHVAGRGRDYSQPRPELGHVTNAAAFIGRRHMSQGLFLDRRAFLVSYDYRHDPTGEVLEAVLLTVSPVGAGISLEYYFSTVDNEHYGSGTKVTHNVTGLFGVMEGAASDLRTGLPKQMIEIHEPMRLHMIIEAELETVTAVYQRQPALQTLIGNRWVLLAVKSPHNAELYSFDPEHGFKRWQGPSYTLPTVTHSMDWYAGHMTPLPPARIMSSKGALDV